MKDKKILKFPSKKPIEKEFEPELEVKKEVKKESVKRIKITNEKLLKNISKQEKQSLLFEIDLIHETMMKDAPNFKIFNLLIQTQDNKMTYEDIPKGEKELKDYLELCDIQAQALVHMLGYIPADTLIGFFKYFEQFKDLYDEWDAKDNYPLNKEHEYYQFFNKMKDAANKLKEDNKKTDRD